MAVCVLIVANDVALSAYPASAATVLLGGVAYTIAVATLAAQAAAALGWLRLALTPHLRSINPSSSSPPPSSVKVGLNSYQTALVLLYLPVMAHWVGPLLSAWGIVGPGGAAPSLDHIAPASSLKLKRGAFHPARLVPGFVFDWSEASAAFGTASFPLLPARMCASLWEMGTLGLGLALALPVAAHLWKAASASEATYGPKVSRATPARAPFFTLPL